MQLQSNRSLRLELGWFPRGDLKDVTKCSCSLIVDKLLHRDRAAQFRFRGKSNLRLTCSE